VGFQRPGDAAVGWIEAECDSLCVLVRRVEGVVQIHEERVAAPPEVVFDV
jgi:hypothetical protein